MTEPQLLVRPDWDRYFLKLAMLASERATCPRLHCGCVLVRNKYVITTGYNGSIPGLPHCEEVGCLLEDDHCVRTIHAEQNAILQAARYGVSVDGTTAYVTNMPCVSCAKSLIIAGIKRVVIFAGYHADSYSRSFFEQADVEVCMLAQPELTIQYDIASFQSAHQRKEDT